MCSRKIFMNGKQRLFKVEGVLGYMIFSIITLHDPCGGEVDIFMFSNIINPPKGITSTSAEIFRVVFR